MNTKIIRKFKKLPNNNSIILICVAKNEKVHLPFFISYYSNLGVTHFVFIDNDSSDNSLEFLENCKKNIMLLKTTDSYKESNFGMDWVNNMLRNWFYKKWCLVVDIDELLILDDGDLNTLRKQMKNKNANLTNTMLIDFYPSEFYSNNSLENNIDNKNKYQEGSPFYFSSNYFDKFEKKHYIIGNTKDGSKFVKGGLRKRIYNLGFDYATLTKKSFFYNNLSKTHRLSVGMHWWIPKEFLKKEKPWWEYDEVSWKKYKNFVKYYDQIIYIGHFKYLRSNVFEYFKSRYESKCDWNDSIEYKKYATETTNSFYSSKISIKCKDLRDVISNYKKYIQ